MIAMMILSVSAERFYSEGMAHALGWTARLRGHRAAPPGEEK
jgi:hypothetical protein